MKLCIADAAKGIVFAFCVAVMCGWFAWGSGIEREGVGTAHFIDKIINYYYCTMPPTNVQHMDGSMLLLVLLKHLLCLVLRLADLLHVIVSMWLIVSTVLGRLCFLFLLVCAAGKRIYVGLGVDLLYDFVDFVGL